jgi:DNA-binding PadR family transcriptional regulator
MLEDGGFVTSDQVDGKRTYTITDAGRAMLAERDDDAADVDDDTHGPSVSQRRVVEEIGKLGAAVMSARGSSDETLQQVREVIKDARKQVYEILGGADD